MPDRAHAVVALRSDAVTVLVDITTGRLPAVVHWGADIGDLSPDDVDALLISGVHPIAANLVDEPVRVSVLPEHWTGWVGRPGLSGSRGGRDWSPKFTVTEVRLDGSVVEAGIDRPTLINTGAGSVAVDAVDSVAQLRLTITLELLASGLLRGQAELTNQSSDPYELLDCVLTFPVPQSAREILDMAGRWGKERVPQRRSLGVGMHLRENRKGRTGADAATVLHVGVPGFSFADGEIWALHTGWSGNHTHYVERLSTGDQVVGGGELLLPGEVILTEGGTYRSPWIYGSYGVGLDAIASRFHRYLRSREGHPSAERPVTLNVWEAVYFKHDLDRLVELAEVAAEIGVERYVLDDGWFRRPADGSRRSRRLDGVHRSLAAGPASAGQQGDRTRHAVRSVVRARNDQSGLRRCPRAPRVVMATGNRLPVESRYQQVINLGLPDCYAYIRDAIFEILAEYPISYLKWDHNRDLIDAGSSPSGRPGVHAQTVAFYRLLDEIKTAHPQLEIESCSSGGGRVDLGVLSGPIESGCLTASIRWSGSRSNAGPRS